MILLARRCFHWCFAIFIPNPGEMIQFSPPCFKMGEEKTVWCLVLSKCATGWGLTTGQENLEAISARMGEQWGQVGRVVGNVPTFRPRGKPVKIRSCRWNFGEVEMWRWGGKKVFNQKTRWWFQTYISFSLPLFSELSCFGYLFGACFASIIQLGDIPNRYIYKYPLFQRCIYRVD